MQDLINLVQATYKRDDVPEFNAGDTLNVAVKITEGDKERTQFFKGVCIQRRGEGATETFTVRKISGGIEIGRASCRERV
jgi:large subunit ribosomal protein L19